MSTLSVVIPAYSYSDELVSMLYRNATQYGKMCDEVIVVEDGGFEMRYGRIADTYIYHRDNLGFTKSVNDGWKLAQGDYVAIVNSDTYVEEGNIYDLCQQGWITHPRPAVGDMQFGAFFVVPRFFPWAEHHLDERLRMYYSDDLYYEKNKARIKEVSEVVFRHAYGMTTRDLGEDWIKEQTERDRKIYEEIKRV